MEAALRTAADWLTGGEMKKLNFEEVRGVAPIKEATYKIGDLELHVGSYQRSCQCPQGTGERQERRKAL